MFSMTTLLSNFLLLASPFVSAYTQPVGPVPVGNPFTFLSHPMIIIAGQTYDVTWNVTSNPPGTVTLLLLEGPTPTQLHVVYPIAEKIPNNGLFRWTPSTALNSTGPDVPGGYGLQLVVDADGSYQYTAFFGIDNPEQDAAKFKSESATKATAGGASVVTGAVSTTAPAPAGTSTSAAAVVGTTSTSTVAGNNATATATTGQPAPPTRIPSGAGAVKGASAFGAVVAVAVMSLML